MKAVGLGLVALGALVMSSCVTAPPATPRGAPEKLRIAIPELVPRMSGPDEGDLARILTEMVGHGLRFSSLFTVVAGEPPLPSDPAALGKRLADLAAAGTHVAMQGWVAVSGPRVTVEFRLLDLRSPGFRPIASKAFWAEPLRQHRGLAHRIADEIVHRLTGERGIAGTKIAYVTRVGAHKELAMMDYDGFSQQALTGLQSISLWPAWSPAGSSIAFVSFSQGYPALFQLTPFVPGHRATHLISALSQQSPVAWSPDETTIALALSTPGNAEIYSIRLGTSSFRRLTHHDGIDVDPTWAPSGREIAFSSDREGGPPRIWIMDDQGLNARRLTGGSYDTQPRWSPRGDTIVFTRRQAGRFDLWAISPDGSNERRLTTGPGSNESAAWAPNGRHLVFASTRTGRSQLFTMLANGTEQHGPLHTDADAWSPSWSPPPRDTGGLP
jgi:TolB protein